MLAAIFMAAGSTDPSAIKIALIGGFAVVIAALIPALLSLRERVPKEIQRLQRNDAAYRRRLEHDAREAEDDLDTCRDKLHELERFVWSLGYDPETKQRVGPSGGS